MTIPFNSDKFYSLSVIKDIQPHSAYTVYIKGIPEIISSMCNYILVNDSKIEFNKQHLDYFNEKTKEGCRLIALAYKELDID